MRQTQWVTGLRSCIKVGCSVLGHPCSWSRRSAVATTSSLPNQVCDIGTPFKGAFIGILYLMCQIRTPKNPKFYFSNQWPTQNFLWKFFIFFILFFILNDPKIPTLRMISFETYVMFITLEFSNKQKSVILALSWLQLSHSYHKLTSLMRSGQRSRCPCPSQMAKQTSSSSVCTTLTERLRHWESIIMESMTQHWKRSELQR